MQINPNNAYTKDKENNKSYTPKNIFENIKKLLNWRLVIIYILTTLISMISLKIRDYTILPFGIACFTGALSFGMPIFILYIIIFLVTIIKFKIGSAVFFLITSVLIIFSTVIKNSVREKKLNEKVRIGSNLIIISVLVNLIVYGFKNIDIVIESTAITYICFKVYVNSIGYILDSKEKKIFAKEEILGFVTIVSLALTILSNINIGNVPIPYILGLLLVIYINYKEGIFVGFLSEINTWLIITFTTNMNWLFLEILIVVGFIFGIVNLIVNNGKKKEFIRKQLFLPISGGSLNEGIFSIKEYENDGEISIDTVIITNKKQSTIYKVLDDNKILLGFTSNNFNKKIGDNKRISQNEIIESIQDENERKPEPFDIAVLDLKNKQFEIIKLASEATFIKKDRDVMIIKTDIQDEICKYGNKIENGEIIVICNKDIINANINSSDVNENFLWLSKILHKIDEKNPMIIANCIIDKVSSNYEDVDKKNIALIVIRILKK